MSDDKKKKNESETEDNGDGEAASKKASPVMSIVTNVGVALLMGGAAAGVVFLAPVGGGKCTPAKTADAGHKKKTKSYDEIVFVNLDPLTVTLGPNANAQYLKISISLETTADHAKAAEHLQPRFRDVLNMYLRAVDEKDLVEPFAMTRLRAQMLRRMQTVASSDIVSDVLITDFVLN
ncbi:MAG: flagellar basal body-associated FliL family protein [Hyphococcus sp.]